MEDEDRQEYSAALRAKFSRKLQELEELRATNKDLWSKVFELEGSILTLESKSCKYLKQIRQLERSFQNLNHNDLEDNELEIPPSRINRNGDEDILAPSTDEAFELPQNRDDLFEVLMERLSKISYEIGEAKLANDRLRERIEQLKKDEFELEAQHDSYRTQIESLAEVLEVLASERKQQDGDQPGVEETERSDKIFDDESSFGEEQSFDRGFALVLDDNLNTRSQDESIYFELDKTWIAIPPVQIALSEEKEEAPKSKSKKKDAPPTKKSRPVKVAGIPLDYDEMGNEPMLFNDEEDEEIWANPYLLERQMNKIKSRKPRETKVKLSTSDDPVNKTSSKKPLRTSEVTNSKRVEASKPSKPVSRTSKIKPSKTSKREETKVFKKSPKQILDDLDSFDPFSRGKNSDGDTAATAALSPASSIPSPPKIMGKRKNSGRPLNDIRYIEI